MTETIPQNRCCRPIFRLSHLCYSTKSANYINPLKRNKWLKSIQAAALFYRAKCTIIFAFLLKARAIEGLNTIIAGSAVKNLEVRSYNDD